jgi:hypothetical protein
MGDISIKVSVRCRPFTIDDKLGVVLSQKSEEEGEVQLINCDYSTTRFPFTYCWWTGFGYQRHLKGDNMPDADGMELIDQNKAYAQCGMKIKKENKNKAKKSRGTGKWQAKRRAKKAAAE